MTSTRSRVLSSAIGSPSQGMPAPCPLPRKSVCRSRKSMLSEPSPRTMRAASVISSSVECGDTSAPSAMPPSLPAMSCSACATKSSAVFQSTVIHSPPCLIIGAVNRSALASASYENRSLSEIQHSLIASFSSGSTRMTWSFFTCTMRLLPSASCGDTDLRRESSHVRAA